MPWSHLILENTKCAPIPSPPMIYRRLNIHVWTLSITKMWQSESNLFRCQFKLPIVLPENWSKHNIRGKRRDIIIRVIRDVAADGTLPARHYRLIWDICRRLRRDSEVGRSKCGFLDLTRHRGCLNVQSCISHVMKIGEKYKVNRNLFGQSSTIWTLNPWL